jgi:uncharacterized membrane protein
MFANVVGRSRRLVGQRKRPLVKTGTYRLVSLAVTIWAAYLIAGDLRVAVDVGVIANAAKMLVYYGHERAWDGVDWGRG